MMSVVMVGGGGGGGGDDGGGFASYIAIVRDVQLMYEYRRGT